jgi:arylsulfatase A-like enzyme
MEATQRPNIVLIMIESWDGRVVGKLGDPALKNVTPNYDQFAQEGTMFENNYTSHPICCPARANMWSGRYTFNCKSWNNHKGLEKGTLILKDVLEKEGNYVFASNKIGIGKHDYISGGHSQQNRVTAWTGAANIHLPSYLQKKPLIQKFNVKKSHVIDWKRAAKAKKFLNKQVKNRIKGETNPFFLYLSLTLPHPRFRTTKTWLNKVDYDKVSIPPKDNEIHPTIKYQQINKDWKWGFEPEKVKKTRAIYYAMVAETDAIIGSVLNEMEKLGLNENTYVIITADHGENNMEHELFYKMNMYDSSVRTPLAIKGPNIQKGKVNDNFASLIDLYPTILEMADIPADKAPTPLDGQSLLPLMNGQKEVGRDYAFSMYTGTAANTSLFMLRKDEYKYIAYPGFEPQLFNLNEDPDELHNLAKKLPEVVKEMDFKLREVVDYEEVHKEWQIYCKSSFTKWREKVKAHPISLFEYGAAKPRATYEEVMANTYKGWTSQHAQQLEEWLNKD